MDASALHCPNCGAVADPDARRCPYCQARLATVSCPQCFALMFDGAAFCPNCGAARTRREHEEEDTTVRCPSCRSQLQRVDIGATPLRECAACDGVWVDAEVFERLCADRESQAAVLPRLSNRAPGKTVGPVRYRPCVRCDKMMNRVNFGRMSGAIVDVCKGHGIFLDAGELHQIVAFIQSGGLERARAQKIEDLKVEERKLRNMELRVEKRYTAPQSGSTGRTFDGFDLADLIDFILE
jgi:Zn-finger nucleic acid-binding protein/RNA polymerase subunit RPABC4/transcription elongation factor Spt4